VTVQFVAFSLLFSLG